MVSADWRPVESGRALYFRVGDLVVPLREADLGDGAAQRAAISIWEAAVGLPPRGRLAYWRWQRGLRRLERDIQRVIAEEVADSTLTE